jgi:hypothetical protein
MFEGLCEEALQIHCGFREQNFGQKIKLQKKIYFSLGKGSHF